MALRKHVPVVLAALAAILVPHVALAAIDLSGEYNPLPHEDGQERGDGPDAGDFAGLPINEAGRMRGNTWNASLITMPERQCIPHPAPYENRSVGFLRMWQRRDDQTQEIIAYETQQRAYLSRRTIWMDGRPHPPASFIHTFEGFSTGTWDGDVLVVRTTHMKPSFIRRNGLPMSDQAEMTERFIRHDDLLLHVMTLVDPVYLAEPLVKTTVMKVNMIPTVRPYPCRPAVEVPRAKGVVPHNPMGDLEESKEYAGRHGISLEAAQGGPQTALPEFMDRAAAPMTARAAR